MTFSRTFRKAEEAETCAKCGSEMTWRQKRPYPVVIQILFAASFVAFLIFQEHLYGNRLVLVIWSIVQILLGVLLVRGRMQAQKRVLRCIRCSADLP